MSDILSPGSGAVTEGFARLDRIVMRWVKVFLRISNRADFGALRAHPQVEFSFIGPGMRIPHADLIILPGSKSVQPDLDWMMREGWGNAIKRQPHQQPYLVNFLERSKSQKPQMPRHVHATSRARR